MKRIVVAVSRPETRPRARAVILIKGATVDGLPEDHDRFFKTEIPHEKIGLHQLVPDHEQPKSTATAIDRMRQAAAGGMEKRKPITVRPRGDGTFHILDGNATFHAAKQSGWKTIPATISKSVDNGAATMPPPAFHAPAAHAHAGQSAQHENQPEPYAARQPHSNPDKLYASAGQHKEWLDNVIDRNRGASAHLGFHVVDGKPSVADYEEGHRRGGMVVLAPLKGRKRLDEKVNDRYGGDYSRARDISRASIAVSHPDDIPHVVSKLHELGFRHGAKPEDRFQNPTDAGYRDMQMYPKGPNGHIGELQLHSLDHMQAKEHGFGGKFADSGHHMYESLRSIPSKMTQEHVKHVEDLHRRSQELYAEADRRAAARQPRFAMAKAVSKDRSGPLRALLPGFFLYDGAPARRRKYAGRPEVFNGRGWHPVKDWGHFAHAATRVDRSRFAAAIKSTRH